MHRSRATLNFLTLLTSRLVSQIVSLGVGLLLVRWLTDDLFAAYSLATTSIGLAGIVVDFGLDAILIRDSAANSSRASSLFYNAIWIRMVIGGGVAAALVLVAGDLTGRRDLLLIGGLALLPRAVLRSTAAILTGQGRVRAAAILEAVGTLAVSLLTVALALILPLSGIDGAAAAIIALLVGNVVGMAAALRVRPTQTQDSDSPSNRLRERGLGGEGIPNQLTDLLRAGLPFLLVALAGAAFQSLDLYIVQRFHTIPNAPIDPLALYAAPFRVLNVLLLVPTAWGVVALPRYVQRLGDRGLLRRDLLINALIGVTLSLGCTLTAPILAPLALGSTYASAAPILALIGWMTLPVCLSAPLIAWITAQGKQSRITVSVLIGGIVALLLHLLWAQIAPGDVQTRLIGVAAIKVIAMTILLGCYGLSTGLTSSFVNRQPQSTLK